MGGVAVGEGAANAGAAAEARKLPLFQARLEPDREVVAALAGQRVLAFAGIGDPEKVFATLREAGIVVAATRSFADHHRYREAEIARLRETAMRGGARLVTTAKDRVRLPPSWRAGIEVLEVELRWHDSAALDRLLSGFDDERDRRAAGD